MATPMPMMSPWWTFVVRGGAAILFGILIFAMPKMALVTLVLLFGAYAIVAGALDVAAGLQPTEGRSRSRRWALLLEGIISISAGIIAFVVPRITALWLLFLIAGWALVTGALEIVAAIRMRREIKGEWRLALGGVLSVAFGVFLIFAPGAGALAVLFWIGAYAIVIGALLIALGVKIRSWTRTQGPGFGEFAPHPAR